MNVFIFIDMSNQFNPKGSNEKRSEILSQSNTNHFTFKNTACLVGIGGFRNRRITFMNHAAILNGIRYGECWNPRVNRDVICLSKREVSKSNEILENIAKYIKSNFGACDQREKGFFGIKISAVEDQILIKQLSKIQKDIELKYNVKCFIGAASDPMIARLSCLMSAGKPRVTTQSLLKSLISQVPLKIFGIPRKIEKVLVQKSSYDSGLLRRLSILQLRQLLENDNPKHALDLFRVIRGIDPFNKQIKIPKKQLSHILRFDQPITDPLTLYLSIENRWTEFRDFIFRSSITINKLRCKLLSFQNESQNIHVFDNSNELLSHRISWRKELRNSIYRAHIGKPILAVQLVADYHQVTKQYNGTELTPTIDDTQSNSAKIHISNLAAKLDKRRKAKHSTQRFDLLSNVALKHKDQKDTDSLSKHQ